MTDGPAWVRPLTSERDETLLQFATERQRQVIEAYWEHGSYGKAAKALDCDAALVGSVIKAVKKKAGLAGHSPQDDRNGMAPPGYTVKGKSTLLGPDGQIKAQWVKTDLDKAAYLLALETGFRDAIADLRGVIAPVPLEAAPEPSLLNVVPIGDPHIGMLAWAPEAGADHDLDIGRRDLLGGFGHLMTSAPPAAVCVVLNLGDFFHADNAQARTPQSGHALDVDGRYAKTIRIGVGIMIDLIRMALAKHDRVIVRNNPGNHDPQSALWLSLALDMAFASEPRVTIDPGTAHHWYHLHGQTLIGASHMDRGKPADMPGIMAADVPRLWGQATHRYYYGGHVHHVTAKEYNGVIVEQFQTLAAKDAWHAAQYRAGQRIQRITLHDEDGEVGRETASIARIRRLQAAA